MPDLPTLKVVIDEDIAPGWTHLPQAEAKAGEVLQRLWRQEAPALGLGDADIPWEVTLLLLDDAEMREINREHRGKDTPTNVLSFPQWDFTDTGLREEWRNLAALGEAVPLGDILCSISTLERESKEQNKPLVDHFIHLLAHGLLHLLGYDHEDDQEASVMEARESAFLATLGIPDPYETPHHL